MKTQGTYLYGEEEEREQECLLLKTEHMLQNHYNEGLYLVKKLQLVIEVRFSHVSGRKTPLCFKCSSYQNCHNGRILKRIYKPRCHQGDCM